MKILLAIILAIILTIVITEPVMAYDVPYHPGNDRYFEIDPETGVVKEIGNSTPNRDYMTGKALVHGIDYGWDTSVAGGKFWVRR